MTSKHDFNAFLDTQDLRDPPYHEQLLAIHEFELDREATLKQQGAIDALQSLTVTLSTLCLRDDVKGDYYFGMHTALELVRGNLDIAKGGIA